MCEETSTNYKRTRCVKDNATIKKDDKSKGSKFEPLKHQLLCSVLI